MELKLHTCAVAKQPAIDHSQAIKAEFDKLSEMNLMDLALFPFQVCEKAESGARTLAELYVYTIKPLTCIRLNTPYSLPKKSSIYHRISELCGHTSTPMDTLSRH